MVRVLCSSLTGNVINTDKVHPIIQIDQFGTHYFKNYAELKTWYNTTQGERQDLGGYFDADDYTGEIIPNDWATRQTVNIDKGTYNFKNETNAKAWIVKQ